MKTPKRCGRCGSEDIQAVASLDVTVPWKDYPSVLLTQPYPGWKCGSCGELILNASRAKELDSIIEQSLTQHVVFFINQIMEREKCDQKEVAAHLGVSPQYLSEVKSGRKIPSFQTFNFLKTLALNNQSFVISAPNFKDWKTA